MNRKHTLITLLRILALTICYSTLPLGQYHAYSQTPPVSDPVIDMIRSQTDSLNRKDVDAYMATIYPDTPVFSTTKDVVKKLFEKYDLRYTLEKTEILSMSESEATLRVVQTTEKVSGPDFRNNRMDVVHTLKRHDGLWKIYSTKMNKLEYLDQ